jgi:hypothetical protein
MTLLVIDQSILAFPQRVFALKILIEAALNNSNDILFPIAIVHIVIHLGLMNVIKFYM